MDTNNDGVIDLQEMRAFLDRHDNGQRRRKMAITRLFEIIDSDNDGTLEHTEVVEAVATIPAVSILIDNEPSLKPLLENADDLMEVFQKMDKDLQLLLKSVEYYRYC